MNSAKPPATEYADVPGQQFLFASAVGEGKRRRRAVPKKRHTWDLEPDLAHGLRPANPAAPIAPAFVSRVRRLVTDERGGRWAVTMCSVRSRELRYVLYRAVPRQQWRGAGPFGFAELRRRFARLAPEEVPLRGLLVRCEEDGLEYVLDDSQLVCVDKSA